jgi:hypothetical protein
MHVRQRIFPIGILLIGLLTTSCATTQSRYVMLGQSYPARAEDCDLEVLRNGNPDKEFIKISRVDVHMEKTHFIQSGLESALPELKKQACLSGADAIIEIQERSSSHIETQIYHVTATGIKYKQ